MVSTSGNSGMGQNLTRADARHKQQKSAETLPSLAALAGRGAPAAEVDRHFARAARRYDMLNDILSFALHRVWKAHLLNWLDPPKTGAASFLDVASGTGDIASLFLRRAADGRAFCADRNPAMLMLARERLAGFAPRAHCLAADAQNLPFAAKRFDSCAIAFGIRNVEDRAAALAEMRRVLKTGGRFLCLEFAPPEAPAIAALYDIYRRYGLPVLGRIFSGAREPYDYLQTSIAAFPPRRRFAAALEQAGFARVHMRVLSGGIAVLYSGWRF